MRLRYLLRGVRLAVPWIVVALDGHVDEPIKQTVSGVVALLDFNTLPSQSA